MKNVIFGTGPLARATANALVARGEEVSMVNRSGQLENAPSGVKLVKADLYDLTQANAASQGAAVVYNCTAPEYSAKAWREQLPVLWGNILKVAASHNAKLVVGDNLYIYDHVGTNIHEDLPMHANSQKGQARIAVVKEHLEAQQKGLVEVAFVRGADFFGAYASEQSHLGSRVFPPMLQGKAAQVVGNPNMVHSTTYLEDFGLAMALVANEPSAFGQAWHVPNAPARSRRETLELVAAMIGLPLKIQPMGTTLLKVLGLVVPPLREVAEMMYQFERPYIVNHQKFISTFGDIHTPLEIALERTLEWFRSQNR